MTTDWGDVPTWISAITTLGALAAAGWVVAIELRRDNRATKARESAEQADLVAAWLTSDDDSDTYWVNLQNGSPLPVYDVRVLLMPEQAVREGNPKRIGEWIPTIPVVPPGTLRLVWEPEVDQPWKTKWEAAVSFRDAASREWLRDGDGRLLRRDEPRN